MNNVPTPPATESQKSTIRVGLDEQAQRVVIEVSAPAPSGGVAQIRLYYTDLEAASVAQAIVMAAAELRKKPRPSLVALPGGKS